MIPRSSRPALPLLLLALLGMLACGDENPDTPDRDEDPATPETSAAPDTPPGEADPDSLETDISAAPDSTFRCRQEGFPCTWSEVDAETIRRSVELGSETLERLDVEAPREAAERLAALPEVAEATPTEGGLHFRLDGGRRVWVIHDDGHTHRGSGPLATARGGSRGVSEVMTAPSTLRLGLDHRAPLHLAPDVVGKDRDNNNKINQRDDRRALILDPYRHEFVDADAEYNQGRAIQALFDASPDYSEATLLEDGGADMGSFMNWQRYDVVHVASHGATGCELDLTDLCDDWVLFSGETVDPSTMTEEEAENFEWFAELQGIELTVSKKNADHEVTAPGEIWNLGANQDFFLQNYPGGLEKTFVFLDACSSIVTYTSAYLTQSPDRGSTVLGWVASVEVGDAEAASLRLYELMLNEGIHVESTRERLTDENLIETINVDGRSQRNLTTLSDGRHRLREVVALLDADPIAAAAGELMTDGDDLTEMIDGTLGDGEDDHLTVQAGIEGIDPDAVASTRIRLVLDDEPLGEWQPLDLERKIGNRFVVDFEGVPVDRDLKPDREYELEALAQLPEDGHSRYSAFVNGRACGWSLRVSGEPVNGRWTGSHFVIARASGDLGLSLVPQRGENQLVQFSISVEGIPPGAIGTYEVGFSAPGVPGDANIPFRGEGPEDSMLWPGNGQDDRPPPSTLAITRNDSIIEGTLNGEFFSMNRPGVPGINTFDVYIWFRARVDGTGSGTWQAPCGLPSASRDG